MLEENLDDYIRNFERYMKIGTVTDENSDV
jgi:hypothetical protein